MEAAGCAIPEPNLLLIFSFTQCLLGFPTWRLPYYWLYSFNLVLLPFFLLGHTFHKSSYHTKSPICPVQYNYFMKLLKAFAWDLFHIFCWGIVLYTAIINVSGPIPYYCCLRSKNEYRLGLQTKSKPYLGQRAMWLLDLWVIRGHPNYYKTLLVSVGKLEKIIEALNGRFLKIDNVSEEIHENKCNIQVEQLFNNKNFLGRI